MTKFNLTLAAALVASSLYLVKTSHDSRTLFAAIDRARTEEAKLDADFKRLEAERQQQATTQRVERTARDRLGMRAVHPAVTHYVQDPATRSAVADASTATTAASSTAAQTAAVSTTAATGAAARVVPGAAR